MRAGVKGKGSMRSLLNALMERRDVDFLTKQWDVLNGATIFHLMAFLGDLTMLQNMITYANDNFFSIVETMMTQRNNSGWTVLHFAAAQRQKAVLLVLFNNTSNDVARRLLAMIDFAERTPLDVAREFGRTQHYPLINTVREGTGPSGPAGPSGGFVVVATVDSDDDDDDMELSPDPPYFPE